MSATAIRPAPLDALTSTTSPPRRIPASISWAVATDVGVSTCATPAARAPRRTGADRDQDVGPGCCCRPADVLVFRLAVCTELKHLTQYRHRTVLAAECRQSLQGGAHGIGVGVVGVIHHGDAAAAGDLHP